MDFVKTDLNCLKCHYRHPDNGNCTAVGGFCTAVPASHCPLIPELRNQIDLIELENTKLRNTQKWIKVKDDMPKEHDSIFKKFKNTDKWATGMFETISDDVIVTVKFKDGTKKTYSAVTKDGEWSGLPVIGNPIVTHWMPFPDPAEEENLCVEG